MKAHILFLAAIIILAACGEPTQVQAQADPDGVVSHTVQPGENDPNYWTEERMRNAQPMDMGRVTQPGVCTEEAKECPDGSYVVRSGPNCAFAPCPGEPGYEPPVICTHDAKICPDGSSVGRTGPNCEFAPCPQTTEPYPGTGGVSPGYEGN